MKEESLLEEIGENLLEEAHGMANVTVRADADCFLLCDGEYLDIQLEAGKIVKKQLPVGRHILEFIYTEDANIKVEKEVNFPEAGKSYLVLVQDFKATINAVAEETKRKAEEKEARRKAEEARRQALMEMDFVQKYLDIHHIEMVFRNNFTDNEIKKAIDEEIRPAADLGNTSAQCVLGKCYEFGRGVTRDASETVKWYRKAAELGDSYAQYALGCCYFFGKVVPQSKGEAIKWFQKAAEQGLVVAQYALGYFYYKDLGAHNKAENWFRKAAEQGEWGAKLIFEILYPHHYYNMKYI